MYELKLLNNWDIKAQEEVQVKKDGKWKKIKLLSKQQVKEITKIISQSNVAESTDEYTVYQLK